MVKRGVGFILNFEVELRVLYDRSRIQGEETPYDFICWALTTNPWRDRSRRPGNEWQPSVAALGRLQDDSFIGSKQLHHHY